METGSEVPKLQARALIVHDWLQGLHGSERVVLAMQDLFEGGADIATFMADSDNLPESLSSRVTRVSWLSRLPGLRQRHGSGGRWRYLLPLMPLWFKRVPTHGYDVVISSSHACAIAVRTDAGVPHVAYVHTPIRYVWLDELDQRFNGFQARAVRSLRGWMRRMDLKASKSPDVLLANSTTVQRRITDIWGRESDVVHPPVLLDSSFEDRDDGRAHDPDTFVWIHRFVSYKRPLEVMRAFAKLPDTNLIMVGVGPLADQVAEEASANVSVRGWIEREELEDLLRSAGGFVHVGLEDFGISMVEALAAGTPVLALNSGGATDIVRHGVDGVLIPDADPKTITDAVNVMRSTVWDDVTLRARAEQFSKSVFLSKMRAALVEQGVS